MKLPNFTPLQYNAIQVAVDHLKDDLEDALTEPRLASQERRDLREKFNATKEAKDKLEEYEKGGKKWYKLNL